MDSENHTKEFFKLYISWPLCNQKFLIIASWGGEIPTTHTRTYWNWVQNAKKDGNIPLLIFRASNEQVHLG